MTYREEMGEVEYLHKRMAWMRFMLERAKEFAENVETHGHELTAQRATLWLDEFERVRGE